MKRITIVAIGLLLAACEGEMPKMAETPLGAIPSQPPPAEEADASVATAPATTCCACQCGPGSDAGAIVATASSDAGVAADAAPVAPAITQGNIAGTITATPANLASVSVVYLEDAPIVPGRGMSVRVDNRQMTFSPFVQVVTVGGAVTFVNSDPFPHNVFSPDHERFNLGAVPQLSTSAPHKFTHAGAYTLLCNLHPGMLGYVVVAPSSYYAKTDYKGRYVIKDVPAGTYKITAWAPRLPVVTQSVTVSAAQATVDFELHR